MNFEGEAPSALGFLARGLQSAHMIRRILFLAVIIGGCTPAVPHDLLPRHADDVTLLVTTTPQTRQELDQIPLVPARRPLR